MAVLGVVVIYTALAALTYEGATAPWSPDMTAWTADAIPEHMVIERIPSSCRVRLSFSTRIAATAMHSTVSAASAGRT